MKQIADTVRTRKPGRQEAPRPDKPCCGTLNYMAECRGVTKQTEPGRGRPRPELLNQCIRNFPVVV